MNLLTPDAANAVLKEYLAACGFVKRTCDQRLLDIQRFYDYLLLQQVADLRDVNGTVLTGYVKYLDEYISSRTGRPYMKNTRVMMLTAVKNLFHALYLHELILM